MNKINKLSLPATIIIATIILGGVFYVGQVYKQKSIEKQQKIKIRQEQDAKFARFAQAYKENQAKLKTNQALRTCIDKAVEISDNQKYRECKALGKIENISKCREFRKKMIHDKYVKENHISPDDADDVIDYLMGLDSCSCYLPPEIRHRIDERFEKDRAVCFKKYDKK